MRKLVQIVSFVPLIFDKMETTEPIFTFLGSFYRKNGELQACEELKFSPGSLYKIYEKNTIFGYFLAWGSTKHQPILFKFFNYYFFMEPHKMSP